MMEFSKYHRTEIGIKLIQEIYKKLCCQVPCVLESKGYVPIGIMSAITSWVQI